MASGLVFTTAIVARPSSSHADLRGPRRLACPPLRSAAGNWWAPLFGWSSEPDYIDGAGKPSEAATEGRSAAEERGRLGRAAPRRFALFTEEKARELRMLTMEMDNFHDAMYHSAIASRLASDVRHRPLTATAADL